MNAWPVNTLQTEVLVVGGGLAGLSAALEARRAGRHVLLLSKRRAGRSGNTILAACNMSGFFPGGGDTVADFIDDTLAGARGLADPELVDVLARGAAEAIPFLEGCGIRFVGEAGRLQCKRIPGHRRPRTVCTEHRGIPVATSGLSLTLPLLAAARDAGVRVLEGAAAVRLVRHDGRVQGVVAVGDDGRPWRIRCGAVVLACGGGGRLYGRSNNTRDITGDGFALAYDAGAELRDLEFVQFHPAMGIAPVKVILPTTLFGDGALLRNRDGKRFLLDSVPAGEGEATRDEMSRAIYREVEAGRGVEGGVFLDLAAIPRSLAEARYGDLWRLLERRGCDPAKDPLVVGLAVHFVMGGMTIDRHGASTVPGLYGAGEVTGGVHGANRLGGNALMEAVVFGRVAGRSAAHGPLPPPDDFPADFASPFSEGRADALQTIRGEVRSLLWQGAGVIRSRGTLERGLERWREAAGRFADYAPAGGLSLWFETRNMLAVSRMILEAALHRCESRGAHFRSDFPTADDQRWLGSLRIRKDPVHDEPLYTFVPAG